MTKQPRRPMQPDDIARVVVVEELDVDAEGRFAIVARRVVRRGEYESHLFVVDLRQRQAPRRLSEGRVRDGWPRVAPDGRTIAFIRSWVENEQPAAICLVPVRGGPVRQIVPTPTAARRADGPGFGAVSELAWSPDGSQMAFVAAVDPPISVVGARPAIGSPKSLSSTLRSPTARRMTRTDWRWDESGHRDHWSHVHVLDMAADPSAAPRRVTAGEWSAASITWHPSGHTIAFVADMDTNADLRPRSSIWAVDVRAISGSKPRPLLRAGGPVTSPAFSPNGRWLAAVGVLDTDPLDTDPLDDVSPGLLLTRSSGRSSPIALTPEVDRPIGTWCDTDLHGWMVSGRTGPAWLDDTTIVAALTNRGRSLPERWTINGNTGAVLDSPAVSAERPGQPWADATVHQLAIVPRAQSGGEVTMLGTLDGRAMDVMTVDIASPPELRRFRYHSTFGARWQDSFVQPEMRRIDAMGAGGPIETWVASPPGAGDEMLPTIVDVHGGPLGGWAPSPHIEVTMLVGAGYRVLLPNIRGGQGYGKQWITPQLGDWGGVDVDDVHTVVDDVVDRGWADPERLGIMGLSYGGFVVNWMVGTTNRFRAAVSENGVTNQLSVWANSDCGPDYCRTSLLGDPFSPDGVEKLWRQSPLRHVANVHTPLLMLQAEADLRCPAVDNEQFFIALRHLGREVEYVLYPEAFHTFSSSGRPDRRIDRMQRVLDWFAHHLSVPNQ